MWQLVLGLLHQLSIAPGIVVERNMFAYYKVPLRLLDMTASHTNESTKGLYYILQCPPQLDDDIIPKPRDMQTCNVVDQYKDMWQSKRKHKKPLRKQQPQRAMVNPLPPQYIRSMQWGWRQRRTKRQNEEATMDSSEESTPLQHLGKTHLQQKLVKLAADHHNFKHGTRTKGYHHMYHRDETYNDHIFYDDLHLDGESEKRGQSKS